MKVINPVGRKAGDGFAANSVRGCMCNNEGTFSHANTTADTCAHCGCECGWILSNGNYTTANNINRTSSL